MYMEKDELIEALIERGVIQEIETDDDEPLYSITPEAAAIYGDYLEHPEDMP